MEISTNPKKYRTIKTKKKGSPRESLFSYVLIEVGSMAFIQLCILLKYF